MSNTIKFKGVDIPIKITYKSAMFDLPDLGVDVLAIFEDDRSISNILVNERVMVNLLFYYVKGHCSTIENMLEDLTPEIMQRFREVYWNEVVNFTNPQMRPSLQKYMEIIKKELASPGERLERALSESLDAPESIQPSSPSENSS